MSGYDAGLLKDAPEASRAERQEGYNIDLLAPERTTSPAVGAAATAKSQGRTPSAPPPSSTPPSFPTTGTDEYAGVGGGGKEYSTVSQEEEAHRPAPVSFWRSGKGKLTMALIALIIVAAVVGGAAGATVNKSSNNSSKSSSPTGPVGSTTVSDSSTSHLFGSATATTKTATTAGASFASSGTDGGGASTGSSSFTNSPTSLPPTTSNLASSETVSPFKPVEAAAGVAADKRGQRRSPSVAAYGKNV